MALLKKENVVTLSLRKFDIRCMDINSKVAIIGKPGTGKSTLVKRLLYEHRSIPVGVIMSGTEESNEFYKGIIPDTFVYGKYNQDVVDKLVARQKTAVRKKVSKPNAFLVIDDCMDNKKWIKEETTRGIFKNGRHWELFFMLTMQYCMDIPPELRSCIDYIFILRENMQANRKKLYEHYCGIFTTFDMFCQVFDAVTENYSCLVIKNRCISNKIEDVAFWYRAELIERPFKVGCKAFWKYHYQTYNSHYLSDEEDDINYKGRRGTRTRPCVVVHRRDY